MSTENTAPESEIIDLGFSAGDVDLSRPVMKAGRYQFKIVATNKVPSANNNPDGTKHNLATIFELEQEVDSTKRDENGNVITVKPGFSIKTTKPLQDSGKMRPGQWKEWPTSIQLAASGDKGALNTASWQGKSVLCDVVIRPARVGDDGTPYSESNEISRVHPLPKK